MKKNCVSRGAARQGQALSLARRAELSMCDVGCEARRQRTQCCRSSRNTHRSLSTAFSLVEMLMALLVASLLMVALAPVITKRLNEHVNLGDTQENTKSKSHMILYGDDNCKDIEDKGEYNICKGKFIVPTGFNGNIEVTAIGGGGGGGSALTSSTVEYTTAGVKYFTVPPGVTELKVTIAGGGAGGSAGGYSLNESTLLWKTGGSYTLTGNNIPEIIKNKYVLLTACGAGGGGGKSNTSDNNSDFAGGGGGAGGYFLNKPVLFPNVNSITVRIGGAGGAGSSDNSSNGGTGGNWGGGAGGAGCHTVDCILLSASQGGTYGAGGYALNDIKGTGGKGAVGGGGNGAGCDISSSYTAGQLVAGGAGSGGGGTGGSGRAMDANYCAGGGGGGSAIAAGGGGGATAQSGGGGGGPTWIMELSSEYVASGGGGGGGAGYTDYNMSSGGGGGGGPQGGGGGNGKDWSDTVGYGYPGGGGGPNVFGGNRGAGGIAGYMSGTTKVTTVFGDGNCNGGSQNTNGKPGAMRIGYLDYSKGGLGGASGEWKVDQIIKVRPGDKLEVKVGTGGTGGTAAYINSSGTNVGTVESKNENTQSYIKDSNGNTLISTTTLSDITAYSTISADGSAGNRNINATDAFCKVGIGGTDSSKTGGNATNTTGSPYGGCGGGGGYSLNAGGNGAAGYVKITWNPNKIGTGGGGGSANAIIKQNMSVKSGAIIEYQIASGGIGGNLGTEDNTLQNNIDKKMYKNGGYGGDTIFGTNLSSKKITAGGGYGGFSPFVTGSISSTESYVLYNGTGGTKADICKIDSTLLACQGAINGNSGENDTGGNGAHSRFGTGGLGSANSNGESGVNYGAGGGGAGVKVCLDNSGSCVPYSGGPGSKGRILLEWQE